jgi:tetratricopeptide (TPR) repeat protein
VSVDTDETDRAGLGLCEFSVNFELGGMTFREQKTSDFGVDAQVEMKRDGRGTGRLLALQIKTGPSWFDESYEDGWIFRPEKKHIPYWLNHSLPVYVLLVNLESRAIYWQEITERSLQAGPRGGIHVRVPRANVLATARDPWEAAAEKFAATAAQDYEENLVHLAPSTASLIRAAAASGKGYAQLLCAHLARGRNVPELTVQTLLAGAPSWLVNLAADGFSAVADFAYSHGVDDLAVDALIAAADLYPASRAHLTTTAGLIALQSAPARAAKLLESAQAMSADFNTRIEIGFLILGSRAPATAPITVPPGTARRFAAVDDDAFVLGFLAEQHDRANDLDVAVELAEKALAIEPDGWQWLTGLAHLLSRRSHSLKRQPDDQHRAIELAERAVDQLHQWNGPTEEALRTLLHVLITAGAFSKVLDRGLPPPAGGATEQEAARTEVISAGASAARALGRTGLADSLIGSLPDGNDKEFAVLVHNMAGYDRERLRARWAALLDVLDDAQHEQLILGVMRLADLGVDSSARLDVLVESGKMRPEDQAVVKVIAAATHDLSSGLPALRILSDSDGVAATKMIDLLAASDRLDDAQEAALAAHSRFGEPGFLVKRTGFLMQLGRAGEARTAAHDALADPSLDAIGRRIAHRVLAAIAVRDAESANDAKTQTQSWQRAERHLAQCVSEAGGLQADPHDIWNLIYIQIHLGIYEHAFATLSRHDPEIRSGRDAGLWVTVMDTRPGNTGIFARMLDLADQFDDDPQLSGFLLSMVISRTRDEGQEPATSADARPELGKDLRAHAFAALESHAQRHGGISPNQVITGTSPEELVAQMTELMREDHGPLIDLTEMIRQATVPLGMLATMTRRPYSSTLAQRGIGYYIAGAGSDIDDEADENAASASRDCDVVVDPSALLISSVLGEFEYARGQFRTLFSPTTSQHDTAAGRTELDRRSASSGFVTFDDRTSSLVFTMPDIEGHLAALERLEGLQRALASTQLVLAPSLDTLGKGTIAGGEAWLAPIALAKDRKVSLWSDDIAQRKLARALGVEAFGTTTLQQLRAMQRLNAVGTDSAACEAVLADRRAEVLHALSERIADMPADAGVIIEQARSENWSDAGLAVATIGRPTWWSQSPNPWIELRDVLTAAREDEGPVETWQATAMWGVSFLASEDPSRAAVLIACVCLIDTGTPAHIDHAIAALRMGAEVATRRKAHDPADYLTQAGTQLAVAGVSTDPHTLATQIRSRMRDEPDT